MSSASPTKLCQSPAGEESTPHLSLTKDEVQKGHVFGEHGQEFEIGELLGHGSFAKVYKCRELSSEEVYAVKVVSLEKMKFALDFEGQVKMMLREVAILQSLRHQRIVNLHGFSTRDKHWFLVMELVCHGELFHCIRPNKGMKGVEARHVFLQLLEGIGYIHSQGVIHRDLKPENVLIVHSSPAPPPAKGTLYDVKIADFGLSKVHGGSLSPTRSCVGSPVYAAPEVYTAMKHGKTYDEAVDLWSLGAILYVMLCGLYPFDGRGVPKSICLGAVAQVAGHSTGVAIDKVELRLRNGPVLAYGRGPGGLASLALQSDERIVAVTQETSSIGSTALGTSIFFYTSLNKIIDFKAEDAAAPIVRFAAPKGSQICGLEFDGSVLKGIKSISLSRSLTGFVSEVVGWAGSCVDCVEFQLRAGGSHSYGKEGGCKREPFTLALDEYILFVSQQSSESYLGSSVVFITSKGNVIEINGASATRECRHAVPGDRQIASLHFDGGCLVAAPVLPAEEEKQCADFKMDSPVWQMTVQEEARQMVQGLLQVDPEKRLRVQDCVHLPWVADGDKGEYDIFIKKGSTPHLVERAAEQARTRTFHQDRTRDDFGLDDIKENKEVRNASLPAKTLSNTSTAKMSPASKQQVCGAVAQIRGRLCSSVDRVELHLRGGSIRTYGGHGGDTVGPWPLQPNEIITAVTQEARNTDFGYLGNCVVFYTSLGRVIAMEGSFAVKVHRHAAPQGYQICGLFFEGSRLTGVRVMPVPEKEKAEGDRGLVSQITGRAAEAVDRVELHLKDGTVNAYGGDGGEPTAPWLLHPDEYVIAVQQEHRDTYLGNSIAFFTSLGSVVHVHGRKASHTNMFVAPEGRQVWGLHYEGSRLVEALTCPVSEPGT